MTGKTSKTGKTGETGKTCKTGKTVATAIWNKEKSKMSKTMASKTS